MLGRSVLRYPAAADHILDAAALELLGVVIIMGWDAVCVCSHMTEMLRPALCSKTHTGGQMRRRYALRQGGETDGQNAAGVTG